MAIHDNVNALAWIVNASAWIVNASAWIVNASAWIVNASAWIVNALAWIINASAWIINASAWIVNASAWIVNASAWIVNATLLCKAVLKFDTLCSSATEILKTSSALISWLLGFSNSPRLLVELGYTLNLPLLSLPYEYIQGSYGVHISW
ncbi:MAG: hypothetical protein V7K71_18455 [Nostoc sp.]|uniref:hypothetical protein n=1 Tax=Nostoc sp. TaxID=1180 RepID=UPI002FFA4717